MTGQHARVPIETISRMAELDPGALRVWLAIAAHADPKGVSFPTIQRIAQIAGLRSRATHDAVVRLECAGWLQRIKPGGGRGRSNTYKIHCPGTDANEALGPRNSASLGRSESVTPMGAASESKPRSTPKQTMQSGPAKTEVQDCRQTKEQSENINRSDSFEPHLAPDSSDQHDEVIDLLTQIGFETSVAHKLASTRGVTPALVQALKEQDSPRINNLPGFVRSRIDNQDLVSEEIQQRAHELQAMREGECAYREFQTMSDDLQRRWLDPCMGLLSESQRKACPGTSDEGGTCANEAQDASRDVPFWASEQNVTRPQELVD